jgi:type II secretory pathway component PulK
MNRDAVFACEAGERTGQRGSALVIALVFFLVGTAVAVFILSIGEDLLRAEMRLEEKLQAKLEAESHLDRLIFAGVDAEREGRKLTVDSAYHLPGFPEELDLTGQPISVGSTTIRLYDPGRGFSVNLLAGEAFRRFLVILGAEEDRAAVIAAAYEDWVDEDSRPRLNGAERGWYLNHRGPGAVPRDMRQVSAPDELRLLRGMDASLFERLRPYLSVGGKGEVNLNAAPAPVLAACLDIPLEQAERAVRWREENGRFTGPELERLTGRRPTPFSGTGTLTGTGGEVLDIEIETEVGRARERIHAVVDYTSDEDGFVTVLDCEL